LPRLKNPFTFTGRDEGRKEAHSILPSPDNRNLYTPYLKSNKAILQYRFDPETGRIESLEPLDAQLPTDKGPWHIVYHPTLPVAYFSNEQSLGVSVYDRDTQSGQLKFHSVCEAVSSDEPTEGFSSSDIVITPDGLPVRRIMNRSKTLFGM